MEAMEVAEPPGTWNELARLADHEERGWLILEDGHLLGDEEYWRGVADAWSDADRQHLTKAMWRGLWAAARPGRHAAMDPEERAMLEALPDRVTVYRGIYSYERDGGLYGTPIAGMSWTLDPARAHWFASRFEGIKGWWGGCVISGTVRKTRILALLNGRDESEVVVFPGHVYNRESEPVG